MKDFRGTPLEKGDKCVLVHRLAQKDVIVVAVSPYDGNSMMGKDAIKRNFENIYYYKSVLITSDFTPDKIKKYCPQSKLMKIPQNIVRDNSAILAFVRLAGFEYE